MTWYAVRTAAGSQQPQREYATEPTTLDKDGRPRGKGYRIVPSLNPNVSAVERALTDAGFSHYMPASFRVIRNRRKTRDYTTRRDPLLPGYIFVHGVSDERFPDLTSTPGVAGVLGDGRGRPYVVDIVDILALRTIEAKNYAEALSQMQKLASADIREASKTAAKAKAAARRKLAEGKRVRVLWGKAVGHEATVLGWADDERVRAIIEGLDAVEVLLPYDTVRLVKEDESTALLAAE